MLKNNFEEPQDCFKRLDLLIRYIRNETMLKIKNIEFAFILGKINVYNAMAKQIADRLNHVISRI